MLSNVIACCLCVCTRSAKDLTDLSWSTKQITAVLPVIFNPSSATLRAYPSPPLRWRESREHGPRGLAKAVEHRFCAGSPLGLGLRA